VTTSLIADPSLNAVRGELDRLVAEHAEATGHHAGFGRVNTEAGLSACAGCGWVGQVIARRRSA
jgi:hypothetical protein